MTEAARGSSRVTACPALASPGVKVLYVAAEHSRSHVKRLPKEPTQPSRRAPAPATSDRSRHAAERRTPQDRHP